MSKKTEPVKSVKPKKIDLLKLSASKKTRVLKEAQEKLRQHISESQFWQSFAETERIIINGQTINFEDIDLTSSALPTV
jgi:hypothetical protein